LFLCLGFGDREKEEKVVFLLDEKGEEDAKESRTNILRISEYNSFLMTSSKWDLLIEYLVFG
jgi:hypothetical protein